MRAAAAACAMALPLAAAADQTVTLYGVVDLSMTGTHTRDRGSSLAMQSGVQSGSRWGLRGSHDLGGGWQTRFQLESGFLATTGNSAQGGRLFGRAAWLGVAGPQGELRLGRQTSASSAVLAEFDPFLASYLITGAQTSLQPFNANRSDNTVAYWSPAIAGWKIGVDYSFDPNEPATGGALRSRLASAALAYDGGMWSVAVTFEGARWGRGSGNARAMEAAGGRRDPHAYSVALRGKMGDATLFGAWSLMRHGSTVPAVQWPGQAVYYPDSRVHGLMAGISYRLGAGTVMASWQASLPQDEGALGRAGATHSQQVYSGGYAHDLSPRTNVYAVLGRMHGSWTRPGWHETQYAVGLRHRF